MQRVAIGGTRAARTTCFRLGPAVPRRKHPTCRRACAAAPGSRFHYRSNKRYSFAEVSEIFEHINHVASQNDPISNRDSNQSPSIPPPSTSHHYEGGME